MVASSDKKIKRNNKRRGGPRARRRTVADNGERGIHPLIHY